jgi:hypothetical protein
MVVVSKVRMLGYKVGKLDGGIKSSRAMRRGRMKQLSFPPGQDGN